MDLESIVTSRPPRRRWLAVAGALIGLFAVWKGVELMVRPAPRPSAQNVQSDSAQPSAPEGLLGAKWLMTPDQVLYAVPNASQQSADRVHTESVVFGRDAAVEFEFQSGYLLLVRVTFHGEKSPQTFGATQAVLEREYGAFPPPVEDEQHTLTTEKRLERIAVQHVLHKGPPVEQVLLYRTR
jgi:hypothetical protein